MKIGFSGSRLGMSPHQCQELEILLMENNPDEFHHGCCIGADYQAHIIAMSLSIPIIGHPTYPHWPHVEVQCTEIKEMKLPLDRNRDIVDETDFMIFGPKTHEHLRSGTWSTKRYAEKIGKPFHILGWS